MANLNLDKKIIETLAILKRNNETVKGLKEEKKIENVLKGVAQDKGMNEEQLASAYNEILERTKGINAAIKPYSDANALMQKQIGEDIIKDYEQQGVDNHLLLETQKDFPHIASIKVNATRHLDMVENKKILNSIIQNLIDEGRLDLLTINEEAYFEESKKAYQKNGTHLKGVFESRPDLKIKITYKK